MPVGVSAYVPLANKTLTATTSTVTFSSIDQSYKDLVLVLEVLYGTATSGYYLRFNSDATAGRYNFQGIYISSGLSNTANASTSFIPVSFAYPTTTNPASSTWTISDYAISNKMTSAIYTAGVAENESEFLSGSYIQNSAVTSISVISNNVFGVGSTFSLYGVS